MGLVGGFFFNFTALSPWLRWTSGVTSICLVDDLLQHIGKENSGSE